MNSSRKITSAKDIKISPNKVVIPTKESESHQKTAEPVVTVIQTQIATSPETSTEGALSVIDMSDNYERIIRKFIGSSDVVRGRNGKIYLKMMDMGNHYHLKLGSNHANLFLRRQAIKQSVTLRDRDLKEINDMISAFAEMELDYVDIYLRVAPYIDGIEIDLGDDNQTRIRISPGNVELITESSETMFYRSNITLPFVKPAKEGSVELIQKYMNNIEPGPQILVIAWISYTLAHPKIDTTKFVHLILLGSQGSGKSFLCRLIQRLIDPCTVGLQVLPRNTKDMIVAAQNAHLLLFDNVRKLSQTKSDDLCVAATGGSLSTRRLYSDDDQSVSYLHVALILNGIFDFVTESDLAQRSLAVYLQDMNENDRLSEIDLERQLENDMPVMLAGLFQLIADIFKRRPESKITHPERMIDFSEWLAAMELLDNAPTGVYQQLYSTNLKEAQLHALMENELAAAVYRLADQLESPWKGTPTNLLHELQEHASLLSLRSADWPRSPESLSKRLRTLTSALTFQGVWVRFYKSKDRVIEITTERIEEKY